MINHLNNTSEMYLFISGGPDNLKIQPGVLLDSKAFNPKHTILIPKDRPNLLWDLLHDLMGISYPKFETISLKEEKPKKFKIEEPKEDKPIDSLEQELKGLKAAQIVEKVKNEKGVEITFSLKSKSAIIKKALQIYGS